MPFSPASLRKQNPSRKTKENTTMHVGWLTVCPLSLCQTLATLQFYQSEFYRSVLNTGTKHSLSWVSKYFLWLLDQRGFEWCLSSSSKIPTSSLRREETATGAPTLWDIKSNICISCSADHPRTFLLNPPAGHGCKLRLWHLSGYLKPLGLAWIRLFFFFFTLEWGGLEENWAVRNTLDHNQPYLSRDINKHIL